MTKLRVKKPQIHILIIALSVVLMSSCASMVAKILTNVGADILIEEAEKKSPREYATYKLNSFRKDNPTIQLSATQEAALVPIYAKERENAIALKNIDKKGEAKFIEFVKVIALNLARENTILSGQQYVDRMTGTLKKDYPQANFTQEQLTGLAPIYVEEHNKLKSIVERNNARQLTDMDAMCELEKLSEQTQPKLDAIMTAAQRKIIHKDESKNPKKVCEK